MPKQLGKYEDPLVCSLCGNNNLTILDREEKQVYCHDCDKRRRWKDKALLPNWKATKLEKSITPRGNKRRVPSPKEIYEEWKKGEELTNFQKEVLQESRYGFIWVLDHKVRTQQWHRDKATTDLKQIEKWMDTMKVDYSDR